MWWTWSRFSLCLYLCFRCCVFVCYRLLRWIKIYISQPSPLTLFAWADVRGTNVQSRSFTRSVARPAPRRHRSSPVCLPGRRPARARRPWNVGTPPSPVVVKFMNRNILEARPVGDDAVPLYRWVARVEWTKRTVEGRHCRIYNRQMSKWRDSTAW